MVRRFLYADPLECSGCRNCEIACCYHKEGVMNPRKSRVRFTRVGALSDRPIACHQCKEPPCAKVCPTNAIVRKGDLVVIERDKCIGCGLCVEECFLGAIFLHPDGGQAVKCDMCGYCVDYCPTGALKIIDPNTIADKKRLTFVNRFSQSDNENITSGGSSELEGVG